MHALSALYPHLGRAEDALRMGERHLAALQTVRARDDTEVAAARYAVGVSLWLAGRTEEAAEQLETAAETVLRVLPENHPDHIPAMSGLAVVLAQLGRLDEASSWADRSVQIARTLDQPMMLGQALNNAASISMGAKSWDEAAAMYTEAAASLAEGGGADNALRGLALANSGYALHQLGDLEGAERRLQEALMVVRAGGPASSRYVALALSFYAGVLIDLGRVEEAAPMLAEAGPIWEEAVGPDHRDRLRYSTLLARFHLARGEREEARVLLEDVAARAEAAGVDYEEVRTLLREASGEGGPG
jgi:tetratricopeptide (TPR) repeat protein